MSLATILLGVFALAPAAAGQVPDSSAKSTRGEIEAAIAQGEKIINSPGYSSRIKQAKRRELALLRARLTEGDLQPGDQIDLSVQGEKELTGTFVVTSARFITLPGIADVSVQGVLRSELQNHMTKELSRYLRNPTVHVNTTLRLSFFGAVGKPGFYQLKSEMLIGEAIMAAGGLAGGTDPNKTRVERAGVEIVTREDFAKALVEGRTLDQMSLRAGDEVLVGGNRTPPRGTGLGTVVTVVSSLATFTYFMLQIF